MANLRMKNSKVLLFVLSFTLFATSCIEEEPRIVPDVYVNFTINLALPQFSALNSINNAVKVANYGYNKNGVIVYRFNLDEFLAFDATCPQHIERNTSITLDDEGAAGTATCSHCSTTYSFFNYGQASAGYPLKRYNVRVNGYMLTVSN